MSWKPRLHSSSLAHGCGSALQPGGTVTARGRSDANVAMTTKPTIRPRIGVGVNRPTQKVRRFRQADMFLSRYTRRFRVVCTLHAHRRPGRAPPPPRTMYLLELPSLLTQLRTQLLLRPKLDDDGIRAMPCRFCMCIVCVCVNFKTEPHSTAALKHASASPGGRAFRYPSAYMTTGNRPLPASGAPLCVCTVCPPQSTCQSGKVVARVLTPCCERV